MKATAAARPRSFALAGIRSAAVLAVAVVFTWVAATAAAAAENPGVPVSVAAGVPGHGRAWELVTPADPVSAEVLSVLAVSDDGNELFYSSLGPLPGAPSGYPLFLSSLARRTADGWTSAGISDPDPESASLISFGPDAFGPALGEVIWTNNLTPAPGKVEKGIFRRSLDGSYQLLVTAPNEIPFAGASDDLAHVLFVTNKHLLPGDAARTEGNSVYEVTGTSVRLVDVDANGQLLSSCGSTVPENDAISRDGRRIFFMTRPSCSGPVRAYLREDGLTTRMISASACTFDCGPEADATIVGATPSGSSAFLVTAQKLTDEDEDELPDLYRYDVGDGGLTLLSTEPSGVAVDAQPVTASGDGSRVLYWGEDPSVPGGRHLYLATGTGSRLLAPSAEQFVQLSASGRYAIFSTRDGLLAADGDESLDVYRYDADGETFTLVSAGPAGGDGEFNATIFGGLDGNQAGSHPYRAMSEGGQDVFFNTAERLLPEDHNEVTDVYEWHGGALDLVSAGAGARPSIYLGATPDGRTAFFQTTLTLLPRDRDGGELDFYAARIGGGFAEPQPPAGCPGEGCLPPLQEPIARRRPATAGGRADVIRIRLPRAAARRRQGARGWIRFRAEVPAAGRLLVRARARIAHRLQTVARLSRRVAKAETLDLKMRLTPAARRALAAGGRLRLRLVLRLRPAGTARAVSFVLGGGR